MTRRGLTVMIAAIALAVVVVVALVRSGDEVSETFGYCPDGVTMPSLTACE